MSGLEKRVAKLEAVPPPVRCDACKDWAAVIVYYEGDVAPQGRCPGCGWQRNVLRVVYDEPS